MKTLKQFLSEEVPTDEVHRTFRKHGWKPVGYSGDHGEDQYSHPDHQDHAIVANGKKWKHYIEDSPAKGGRGHESLDKHLANKKNFEAPPEDNREFPMK